MAELSGKNRRELIHDRAEDIDNEVILWNGFDDAIMGTVRVFTGPEVVLYSYKKILESLMSEGMSDEEAQEYFDFNVIGGYLGEGTPAVFYGLEDERY